MLMLPEAPTERVPVTSRINLPFPAPGVLVHELPETEFSNPLADKVPFVTVIEPKVRL
jgi:hypothetical protein